MSQPGPPEQPQLLGDPHAALAVDGVLGDPDLGAPAGGAGRRSAADDAVEDLHDRVLCRGGPRPREEVVRPRAVRASRSRGSARRPADPRLPEDRHEVVVDRGRVHDLRLVPLPLVGHVGEVRRGLERHVAAVLRADVVEQEVLRVRRPARAAAGAPALAGEADELARRRAVREVEPSGRGACATSARRGGPCWRPSQRSPAR